jgi:hypothetical protein
MFYLKPVELLNVERVAFTNRGGRANGYTKYGNRFWKWKTDASLTDAQTEALYNKIKNNYPYGYTTGDTASTNRYILDVKNNETFQSFYKTYWEKNLDQVKQPTFINATETDFPHPYIEFTVNEIITNKYTVGTVPDLPAGTKTDSLYPSGYGAYYEEQPTYSCLGDSISVSVNSLSNVFAVEEIPKFPLKLKASGRHRIDLVSGDPILHWPTGADGNYSGFRFRLSTGVDGTLSGYNDYTTGITYHVSPEAGNYFVKVLTKTPISFGGDDGHPWVDSGHNTGYALSGSGGSATGVNSGGYGYDEGAEITLRRESAYYFRQADSSNSGVPLYFSTTPSGMGSDEYSSGVIYFPSLYTSEWGSGSYVKFTPPHNAPNTLYYSSRNSLYAGGKINLIDAPAATGSGRIPGESIVINNTLTGGLSLWYYTPDSGNMGGLALIKKNCSSTNIFGI